MHFSIFHYVIVLFVVFFVQYPFWKIAKKAGYPGAASLLLLIPVVNIISIWVFALADWPSLRQWK